jgi:hypothetical protein
LSRKILAEKSIPTTTSTTTTKSTTTKSITTKLVQKKLAKPKKIAKSKEKYEHRLNSMMDLMFQMLLVAKPQNRKI